MGAIVSRIEFPVEGTTVRGDLYLPPGVERPPVVVMAHGIGAERRFGLSLFAERFVAAGLAAVVFDYRYFGESDGRPRRWVRPEGQIRDFLAAAEFARSCDRVDGKRLALWGPSFAGGHVLCAAARSKTVTAVVALIPFVDGLASMRYFPLRWQLPALWRGGADLVARRLGRESITVPVVARQGLALLMPPDSFDGYWSLIPPGVEWDGLIPADILARIPFYRPVRFVHRIEAPVLIVAAEQDRLIPIHAVRRAAGRIADCRLLTLPGGHFDLYSGELFERSVAAQIAFLREQLRVESPG